MEQDFTRFCTYCKKSGHAVNFFWSLKEKKLNEEKAPPQPKEFFSQTNSNQQKCRKITDRTKEVVTTAHTLRTAIVAEVTVTLELYALNQNFTW